MISTSNINDLLSARRDPFSEAHGNLTARAVISDGSSRTYSWDHRNRLVAVSDLDGSGNTLLTVTYGYDAFDQLVARHHSAVGPGLSDATYFVWENDQAAMVWQDSDGAAGPTAPHLADRLLWGAGTDQALAAEHFNASGTSTGLFFAMGDHLGSVTEVVGSTGLIEARRFDAFGNLVQVGGPGALPATLAAIWGYTARYTDPVTTLQSNRARWYDPNTGRFISEDPIGFGGGDSNLYAYVGNSPLTHTDPTGHRKGFSPYLKRIRNMRAEQMRAIHEAEEAEDDWSFGLDLGIFNFYVGEGGAGFGVFTAQFNFGWANGFDFDAGFHLGFGIYGVAHAGVNAMFDVDKFEESTFTVGASFAGAYASVGSTANGDLIGGFGFGVPLITGPNGSASIGYGWTFSEDGIREGGISVNASAAGWLRNNNDFVDKVMSFGEKTGLDGRFGEFPGDNRSSNSSSQAAGSLADVLFGGKGLLLHQDAESGQWSSPLLNGVGNAYNAAGNLLGGNRNAKANGTPGADPVKADAAQAMGQSDRNGNPIMLADAGFGELYRYPDGSVTDVQIDMLGGGSRASGMSIEDQLLWATGSSNGGELEQRELLLRYGALVPDQARKHPTSAQLAAAIGNAGAQLNAEQGALLTEAGSTLRNLSNWLGLGRSDEQIFADISRNRQAYGQLGGLYNDLGLSGQKFNFNYTRPSESLGTLCICDFPSAVAAAPELARHNFGLQSGDLLPMPGTGLVLSMARQTIVRGAATSATGNFVVRPVTGIEANRILGTARQQQVARELQLQYPGATIQSEQYLRTATGVRAIDPVTGQARRIDHVVIQNGSVLDSVETTSLNASKRLQTAQEMRIRQAGGTFIRDRTTGQLIDINQVPTRILRKQ